MFCFDDYHTRLQNEVIILISFGLRSGSVTKVDDSGRLKANSHHHCQTRQNCLCLFRFGGVNRIPDNSRLSQTGNLKSERVQRNRHTRHDRDRTVFSCLAGGMNWALDASARPRRLRGCRPEYAVTRPTDCCLLAASLYCDSYAAPGDLFKSRCRDSRFLLVFVGFCPPNWVTACHSTDGGVRWEVQVLRWLDAGKQINRFDGCRRAN